MNTTEPHLKQVRALVLGDLVNIIEAEDANGMLMPVIGLREQDTGYTLVEVRDPETNDVWARSIAPYTWLTIHDGPAKVSA